MSIPAGNLALPSALIRNNEHARGPAGLAWLARLPALLEAFGRRWSISVEPPFPDLSFNYAAPATRADGTRAVLKLSYPGDKEFLSEAAALRAYAGQGIARLLKLDAVAGAMLLERLEPGTPLHALRDERTEIAVAAGIMKELWRPAPPGPFPTVADWGRAFARHREAHGGGSGPLPEVLFDRAEALYHRLDASTRERVLLHGDLHQGNILAAQRRPWLAIDPKGLVGDPLYEVWPILNNLWEEFYEVPDPAEVLKGRVTLLAGALDADPERVRGWGIAGCVLSAIWSAEDGGTEWGPAIAHAEILAADGS